MQTQAHKRITQARAWLLRENVWLGALALKLGPQEISAEEAKRHGLTYMGTDGRRLLYLADAVTQAKNTEEIATVIAHEVAHCALGHFARRGARDPQRWNIATDYAANYLLEQAAFPVAAAGGLLDPRYAGWTAERIYADMQGKEPTPQQKQAASKGAVLDAPDDAQGEGEPNEESGQGSPEQSPSPAQLAQEWQQAAAEAEQIAAAKGDMPGALARRLTKERSQPQDWRALLREFCSDPARNDFRWTPPARKHVWSGLYLPGVRSQEVGALLAAVDTSGSIGAKQLAEFGAELSAILESGLVAELIVIACDAQATMAGRYQRGDSIDLQGLPGGGGTDFRPPFILAEQEGITPTCAVYLTDMYGTFPEVPPAYPVLWVSTSPNVGAPFGTVVEMGA